jgi:hypothetical protein
MTDNYLNRRRKGERRITKQGYFKIYMPEHRPTEPADSRFCAVREW